MLQEFVSKILTLAVPNFHKAGDLEYSDKALNLITPPQAGAVGCSTLQSLVDLFVAELDEMKPDEVLIHITSPTAVELVAKEADEYGRRRVWAKATYPECTTFKFGAWHNPENFIISAQQSFQRVKVQNDDGSFAKDLDYVLSIASKITAEQATSHDDDGIAQRIAIRQGIALKEETTLRGMVNLAPYRTFAEIDQVLSQFVFRARFNDGSVNLALFEADGGRWKLGAVSAIKAWLAPNFGKVPVIS